MFGVYAFALCTDFIRLAFGMLDTAIVIRVRFALARFFVHPHRAFTNAFLVDALLCFGADHAAPILTFTVTAVAFASCAAKIGTVRWPAFVIAKSKAGFAFFMAEIGIFGIDGTNRIVCRAIAMHHHFTVFVRFVAEVLFAVLLDVVLRGCTSFPPIGNIL